MQAVKLKSEALQELQEAFAAPDSDYRRVTVEEVIARNAPGSE